MTQFNHVIDFSAHLARRRAVMEGYAPRVAMPQERRRMEIHVDSRTGATRVRHGNGNWVGID